MEIRTTKTTFDGFYFESDSSVASKSPQQKLTLLELPPVDSPTTFSTPQPDSKTQPVLPLERIDMTQWDTLLPADQGFYLVVSPGQDNPSLMSVYSDSDNSLDLLTPAII